MNFSKNKTNCTPHRDNFHSEVMTSLIIQKIKISLYTMIISIIINKIDKSSKNQKIWEKRVF